MFSTGLGFHCPPATLYSVKSVEFADKRVPGCAGKKRQGHMRFLIKLNDFTYQIYPAINIRHEKQIE